MIDPAAPAFADVVARRISRRGALRAVVVVGGAALGAVVPPSAASSPPSTEGTDARSLAFDAVAPSRGDRIILAGGYRHHVVAAWGDPALAGGEAFSLRGQSAARQGRQVGANCDYVAFCPLPRGSSTSDHGLLHISHEYTDPLMMFVGYDVDAPTHEQVDIQLAAHGFTLVEVQRRNDGTWELLAASPRNRRVTGTTPMRLSGPVAGHERVRTADDPAGVEVLGTLNDCSGGWTPWHTVLVGEENVNIYFANAARCPDAYARADHLAFGVAGAESGRRFERYHPRFDTANPGFVNEPFRFGWVVEHDPYDPTSVPRKRTALGRFKHEAAAGVRADDGRYVVYMGDDEVFQHVYKFVSRDVVDDATTFTSDVLDRGTLYAARFEADDAPAASAASAAGTSGAEARRGRGRWIPLVFGQGALVPPAFADQADVLLRCRAAAHAVGATPMDRPEDIEVHPLDGRVFVSCTNNGLRGLAGYAAPDASNPRPANLSGHIIEITEDGPDRSDHTTTTFAWDLFMVCGDPSDPTTWFAGFDRAEVSPIACPDNLVFDRRGNLVIATDGMPSAFATPTSPGPDDGVYVVPTTGPERGHVKRLVGTVVGSEATGIALTPDDTTLFVAVQHPGEGGTVDQPTSRWPDGATVGVARAAVIAVRREDGAPIAGPGTAPAPGGDVAGGPAGGGTVSLAVPVGALAAVGAVGAGVALRRRSRRVGRTLSSEAPETGR